MDESEKLTRAEAAEWHKTAARAHRRAAEAPEAHAQAWRSAAIEASHAGANAITKLGFEGIDEALTKAVTAAYHADQDAAPAAHNAAATAHDAAAAAIQKG